MTEYVGNLALKRSVSAAPSNKRRVASTIKAKPLVLKTKRVSVAATPKPAAIQHSKAKSIRRSLALQRLKMLLGSILVIFVVAGIFALVVYRQATILEMNFNNLSIERQISRLEQERSQISEELAQKTNLDLIRQQAIERLGLQDPAGIQLVRVIVPVSDRVVFAGTGSSGTNTEAYLAGVYKTVEGYFKSMNQNRQGK